MGVEKFSPEERGILLAVKGVGPKAVERLEQLGVATFARLAIQDADDVCVRASALVGSTCWKNSPQARAAIAAAITAARLAFDAPHGR